MFRYFLVAILIGFTCQLNAQRYKNPQAYFKKFQNENRKLRIKNLRYLKASLKSSDQRKVDKFRQVVLDQAKSSKISVGRIGPYKDYDILQKEYVKAMQMYIDAFEKNFGVADELSKNRYNSYEDLKKYYQAVGKAEEEMLTAAFQIESAEDHFARTYYLKVVRDEEMEEQYALLDEVTLYSRDMTLSFFRIDAQVRMYLKLVERGSLDSLNDVVSEMRRAVIKSKEELKAYDAFEGETALYDQMSEYIEEMEVELNENLGGLTDNLQNEFMEEKEYKLTQRDLNDFIERHNYRSEDFFETKRELIEDYLPEK
jgi:hypothetical protein